MTNGLLLSLTCRNKYKYQDGYTKKGDFHIEVVYWGEKKSFSVKRPQRRFRLEQLNYSTFLYTQTQFPTAPFFAIANKNA